MKPRRGCVSVLAICLMLILGGSGCATAKRVAQAPCDYMAQAKIYKDKIKSMLVASQVGYDMVVGYAGVAKKLPSGPAIMASVVTIDHALDILGKLYYDTICPSMADVAIAENAAIEAQAAQEDLGIQ